MLNLPMFGRAMRSGCVYGSVGRASRSLCGSGACATAVAAHQRGLTGKRVRMELDGGWLTLDWRDDGVWMTGPTAFVYNGQLTPAFLKGL